jgi:hypothetical protein
MGLTAPRKFSGDADELGAEDTVSPNAPGMIPNRRPSASGMMDLRSWRAAARETIMACLTIGTRLYVSRLATSALSIAFYCELSSAVTDGISNLSGDGLGECHVLAAHRRGVPDSLLVDMPNRRPGGSSQRRSSNQLLYRLAGPPAQRAAGERRMLEDGKFVASSFEEMQLR